MVFHVSFFHVTKKQLRLRIEKFQRIKRSKQIENYNPGLYPLSVYKQRIAIFNVFSINITFCCTNPQKRMH